ncbi:hypothetical protein AAAC51_27900 [Priestia megaterium]
MGAFLAVHHNAQLLLKMLFLVLAQILKKQKNNCMNKWNLIKLVGMDQQSIVIEILGENNFMLLRKKGVEFGNKGTQHKGD